MNYQNDTFRNDILYIHVTLLQVTDTTRNTKEESNSSTSNEKEINNLNFQGMSPPPLNSKINSSPSRQLNAATKDAQNTTASSNTIKLTSVAKSTQSTNEQRRNDTEMDAKPATPVTEKSIPFVVAEGIDMKSVPEERCEQMYQLERDILRPKDHNDQPMTPDHLIDIVIVYAKSDYELANEYKEWLITIASTERIFDIKVELYTSEYHFPANDVRVVEEVINKSMRVLMLLSANFTKEVSLTFIKEEAIGLTRLQECQLQEMMSLFATSIMNRKKNCVRPVHTAPPKGRYYRIPPGLSSLRAFSYFQPNKESPYEIDITKAFLKSAREDRKSYTKELISHQACDNPRIVQAIETQMAIPYCNSTSLSNRPDRPDGEKNIDQPTLTINKPLRSQEISDHRSREDHSERGSSDTVNTVSNQEVVNNHMQIQAVQNSNLPRSSNNKLHMEVTNATSADSGFSREEQEDTEYDGNAGTDSSTSKLVTLENSAAGSLIQDSLISDTNLTTLVKFPGKSSEKSSNHNSNLYDKTEHAMKLKQIDIDDAGEVKENNLSYTGPSGRSGIRTGSNPEYRDYMQAVPNSNANTQQPQSSTDNRNEINSKF